MSTEEQTDGGGKKYKKEDKDGIGKKQHFRENTKIPGCIIYTVRLILHQLSNKFLNELV